MTWFDGLKANEIAQELHISVSTVTTQRARALKYLKDVLSEDKLIVLIMLLQSVNRLG
jgi:DNA-directed RNA polymerase specialized sigma24 family protein